MPGFDQTGPQGAGPMTGRGMGRCQPQQAPTNANMPAQTAEQIAQQIPPLQAAQIPPAGVLPAGVVYGLGRGGLPRGCGMGRGFGGGRGRGMGLRNSRW